MPFTSTLASGRALPGGAMYLQAGDLLRTGSVPYVDIIDLNPPLIQYVNAIPAAVADLLGTHLIVTFLVIVWGLTVASALATYGNLRGAFSDAPLQAGLVMLNIALFSAFVMYSGSYGQREHLFVLAVVPFIALGLCRASGAAIGTARAITTGGLAYAIHFFLLPAPMRTAWFDRLVPIVSEGYRAYDQPLKAIVIKQAMPSLRSPPPPTLRTPY